jgi:hypothetical protein
LIDGVAAKMAEEFFNKFIQVVSPAAEVMAPVAATGDEQIQSASVRHQPLMWALAAALLVAGASWFLK